MECPICESNNVDTFIIGWGTCFVCGYDDAIEEFEEDENE